jgi:hypothetical protein
MQSIQEILISNTNISRHSPKYSLTLFEGDDPLASPIFGQGLFDF